MTHLPQILCAGSALWDIIARSERALKPGHDVPGLITRQLGGVALNVALALAARGRHPGLLSAVGCDPAGDRLIAAAQAAGIVCTHVARTEAATDSYLAVEDAHGEVFVAVADCASLEQVCDAVLAPLADGPLGTRAQPYAGWLVVDGNFPPEILDSLSRDATFSAAHLALVPASPGKAARLSRAMRCPRATLYVNRIEAEILCDRPFDDAATAAAALRGAGAAQVVVTDSNRPAAAAFEDTLVTSTPPAVSATTTTGAGDAFLAAHLDLRVAGADPQTALNEAVKAAAAHVSGDIFHHD